MLSDRSSTQYSKFVDKKTKLAVIPDFRYTFRAIERKKHVKKARYAMFVKQYFISLSVLTPEATKPEIPSRLIRNFSWNIVMLKPIKTFHPRRSYRGDAKFLRTSNSSTVTRTRIPQRNPWDIGTRYRQYLKAVYPIERVETSSAVLLCESRGKRKDGKARKKEKNPFVFFLLSFLSKQSPAKNFP